MLFIIFLLSSCTKEDENAPKNILMAKVWKRGMVDKNPSNDIQYYPVRNCEKDDTYKFGSNNNLLNEQGTNKCYINEPAIKTVSYSYNQKDKELIIEGVKYTLAEESKTQIKYYAPVLFHHGYGYVVFLLE